MDPDPLLQAGWVIKVHVAAAITSILVGLLQFVGRKGVTTHRTLGWVWVCSMMVLAISSFWIQEIKFWGNFSPIHILSIVTVINVPLAVLAARKHDVVRHKKGMIGLYMYGLVVAGIFTFAPGRVMYRMFFG